jgi:hypothetical protein
VKKRPKCFVAMPMSDVPGVATKDQWDSMYRKVFVPPIRAAGFDAIRSEPTRGSLIKGIIDELWSADAMLADLTGQKANVFYELGVRHALRGNTIVIAQDARDIPFDLRDCARFIYDPKTIKGKQSISKEIEKLLKDILHNPDRADNPVEAFLLDSQRLHGKLCLSSLNLPQRNACREQLARCEQTIAEIRRGRVPIPSSTAEYFNYFLDLIYAGKGCEDVRVFLSKMDDGSLRYNESLTDLLFRPFKRAVRAKKMRIEYTCLFGSRKKYDELNGRIMLNRHCQFSHSVRFVFLDEMQHQPIQTDRTIVLLRQRKWAITHSWDSDGIVNKPVLLTHEHDYEALRQQYDAIRRHSYSYKCPRSR